ncbi:MAG: ABC transporter substrate-binding protein [Chloroflexi bacterium]|nr:ABC transporter substrate-binding protein [Chloroflexota bacterium]
MRNNAYPAITLSIVLVLVLLAACGPAAPTAAPTKAPAPAATVPSAPAAPTAAAKAEPAKPAPPTAAPLPKIKRGGILVRADIGDATSWDPAFSVNSPEVGKSPALEALLKWELVDEKSGKHEAQPDLAESFEMTDPKTLVIKLRKGVKFHDGSELNAEGTKWHLDRTRTNPKSLGKGFLESITSIDVVDPYTLRLNLKGPSATIFVNLTKSAAGTGSTGTLLISKAAFDKLGEEAMVNKPIGTGPFMMDEWRRDDRTIYKKFDQYWKKGEDGQPLPYLDRIDVRVVRDRAVALIEVKSGTVHVFENMDEKDIAGVKSNPDLTFISLPWAAQRWALGFNPEKSPFGTNLKLRQAAQYAIDRESMAKTLGFGFAIADYYNLWIPAYPGWDESNPKYDFNLDKAKTLLKEAGAGDTVNVGLSFETPGAGQRYAELVQAMWTKAGINATLTGIDRAAVKQAVKAGQFEAHTFSMSASPDPDGWSRMYTCDGSANWSNYCNPEMDKCMAEGRSTYDVKQRHETYKRCLKILYDDAKVFGLYMTPGNVVMRKEVKNLKTSQHLVDLREIWLDK